MSKWVSSKWRHRVEKWFLGQRVNKSNRFWRLSTCPVSEMELRGNAKSTRGREKRQSKRLTLETSSALMRTNSFLLWEPAISLPLVSIALRTHRLSLETQKRPTSQNHFLRLSHHSETTKEHHLTSLFLFSFLCVSLSLSRLLNLVHTLKGTHYKKHQPHITQWIKNTALQTDR